MTTIFDIPGSNPPNCFFKPIQDLVNSTPAPAAYDTAAHLVNIVTTSSDPACALWELWDAFFTAVVTSSTSHATHFALLDALREQAPTRPSNVPARSDAELRLRSYTGAAGELHWPTLPRFSAQWVDVHDILEAWRDWDGVRATKARDEASARASSGSGAEYFLRFSAFSAALLKATNGRGGVHPVRVLYACLAVLERERPRSNQPSAHRMSPEQLRDLNIRVTATWIRDGGQALWEVDREELRRHWAAVLDEGTELWPRTDGLTRARWRFWEERLRALGIEVEGLDEGTREVVAEAARVIKALLHST